MMNVGNDFYFEFLLLESWLFLQVSVMLWYSDRSMNLKLREFYYVLVSTVSRFLQFKIVDFLILICSYFSNEWPNVKLLSLSTSKLVF
jgi:hypothetical protein